MNQYVSIHLCARQTVTAKFKDGDEKIGETLGVGSISGSRKGNMACALLVVDQHCFVGISFWSVVR